MNLELLQADIEDVRAVVFLHFMHDVVCAMHLFCFGQFIDKTERLVLKLTDFPLNLFLHKLNDQDYVLRLV